MKRGPFILTIVLLLTAAGLVWKEAAEENSSAGKRELKGEGSKTASEGQPRNVRIRPGDGPAATARTGKELLEYLREAKSPREQDERLCEVIESLIATDPARAAALLAVGPPGSYDLKEKLARRIFAAWGERDAEAAYRFARIELQGDLEGAARVGVIEAHAQTDPDLAWEWVRDFPPGTRGAAIEAYFELDDHESPVLRSRYLAALDTPGLWFPERKAIVDAAFGSIQRKFVLTHEAGGDPRTVIPEMLELWREVSDCGFYTDTEGLVVLRHGLKVEQPLDALMRLDELPADSRSTAAEFIGQWIRTANSSELEVALLREASPEFYEPAVRRWIELGAQARAVESAEEALEWVANYPDLPNRGELLAQLRAEFADR